MAHSSYRYLPLALLVLLLMIRGANACSCGPRSTVLDEFDTSDEVVIMRIVSVEKAENEAEKTFVNGIRFATLRVEKVFKGKLKVGDEIVFRQGSGADCLWTFSEETIGLELLLYLNRPDKRPANSFLAAMGRDVWYVSFCGRSTGLRNATDDLLYLENVDKVRGKTRVSGTLGSWTHGDIDVEGKRIKIIGPKKTYETKTDKNGVFEIYDVPPGKYFVDAETPRGWKLDPFWLRYSSSVVGSDYWQPEVRSGKQVAIMLEPQKHADVDLKFVIDNVVRGRVLGPTGRPMRGVCVYLVSGKEEDRGPSDCTDEQGRYEITSASPGEYVVVANADGKPSNTQPFRRIYYPSVIERDRATPIRLGPGDSIEDIDFLIPSLEQTITIRGVLRYSDGKPVVNEPVKFKVTQPNSKVDGDVTVETNNGGRFTMKILRGLTGELAGEVWIYEGKYKNCPKVEELISKNKTVTVRTNVIELKAEQDLYDVELTLPIPRCEKVKD